MLHSLIARGAAYKVGTLGLILCLLSGGCRRGNGTPATATTESAALSGTTPAVPTMARSPELRLVIDTDMGADDVMAILFLLRSPDVGVEAITVAGTGLAHCEPGTRNALGLIALTDAGDIPVACGPEAPLQGNHTFPSTWRADADRLYGVTVPASKSSADQAAVELLISSIEAAPEKVVLLALGPLTNIAEALQRNPRFVEKVAMIYIMGGAVDVPGNLGGSDAGIHNQVAEWNIYVDPHAANVVLMSGAPITLIPLDATNDVPITPAFYEKLRENHATPAANAVYELLSKNPYLLQGGFYFWDPVAAVVLTDESLATFEESELKVIEAEGPESGRIVPADDGISVRLAISADRSRFEQRFLDGLNGLRD